MQTPRSIPLLVLLVCASCVAGGPGVPIDGACTLNNECAAGLVCHDGACANLCQDDPDCPADRACENQVCKVVPNPDCRADSECTTPGPCEDPNTPGECVAGRCAYVLHPDNPCDGCENDSTRPCYTGPDGTKNVGICAGGTQTCVDRNWGACTGETVPGTETCNGADDDCDGDVDEDFKGGGAIYDGGPYANDAGKVHGSPCGIGACAGGTVVCNSTGDGLTCSTLDQSTPELCDDLDNDCDGQEDEDYKPGGGVTFGGGPYLTDLGKALGDACGTGDCAGGQVVCDASLSDLTCSTLGNASTDVCDTNDNDCDGTIDEDFVAGPCDTGMPGICSAGTSACEPSGLTCTPDTSPAPGEIACNQLDDDCDGETDEGSYGTSASCPAPNCSDILAAWNASDGVYHIETPSAHASCASNTSRQLYCDMSGGGWTLVMWKDGGHCRPIGPYSGGSMRWFLADCNPWHSAGELVHSPMQRANTDWNGDWGVSSWIDIRTMEWSEIKIAGYQDADGPGPSTAVNVSSSNPIPRSELSAPFGTDGYYLNNSATDGYYWCGGSELAVCKGKQHYGGWDFSASDQPDKWLTVNGDTSGEPNCPSNTVSTCQSPQGNASCWSPQNDGGHGGQAVWIR